MKHEGRHDLAVCRDGVYDVAVMMKAAVKRGHEVTEYHVIRTMPIPEKPFDDVIVVSKA